MKTLTKTILAILSPLLLALSSCDYDEGLDEKQILGTFQLAYFPETTSDSTQYKQQAFTLRPDGSVLFHDMNFKSVFGRYLSEDFEKNEFDDLAQVPSDACSLNGVEGKWKFYDKGKAIDLSIDVATVTNETFKSFLSKYLRDGYYEVPFRNFATYSKPNLVTVDKSAIVLMTYYPDADNIITQFFIKKADKADSRKGTLQN